MGGRTYRPLRLVTFFAILRNEEWRIRVVVGDRMRGSMRVWLMIKTTLTN